MCAKFAPAKFACALFACAKFAHCSGTSGKGRSVIDRQDFFVPGTFLRQTSITFFTIRVLSAAVTALSDTPAFRAISGLVTPWILNLFALLYRYSMTAFSVSDRKVPQRVNSCGTAVKCPPLFLLSVLSAISFS